MQDATHKRTDIRGLGLEDIRLCVGGRVIVSIAASVAPGEVLVVMGPSGAGKSSLLAYVAGLLSPEFEASGRVLLDGEDVTALPADRRRIGLLFQDPMLFPHLSVAGNLLFGLRSSGPDRKARVEAALASAGLGSFGKRDPATLSGGEKARVALLRLLLSEPRAVLLDEPFSKLDAHLRGEIRRLVLDSIMRQGLPALLVTHDEEDARAAGGRVIRV
mgnify:CR=1 FL=1